MCEWVVVRLTHVIMCDFVDAPKTQSIPYKKYESGSEMAMSFLW